MKEKLKFVLSVLFSIFVIIITVSAFAWEYKDAGAAGVLLIIAFGLLTAWMGM